MDPTTFDRIGKLFAHRRLSRRRPLAGGAGLAAGALAAAGIDAKAAAARAPEHAAPAPGVTALAPPAAGGAKPTTFLFLQSFEAGSLVPKPGVPGRYTLTLKQGLGDTVYFSDRPAKVVGTVPTDRFLQGLGFTPADPPNAALVGQRGPTHKDVVVVELFDPHYDAATNTLTYEVALLRDWQKLGVAFQQTPDEAAQLPRAFTAAHLFIDDCADLTRCLGPCGTRGACEGDQGPIPGGPHGQCWRWDQFQCRPCHTTVEALNERCNQTYPGCGGTCNVWGVCTPGLC